MHTYIYLPSSGLLPKRLEHCPILQLVGYCINNTYVVIDYLPPTSVDLALVDPDLRLIGYLVKSKRDPNIGSLPRADFYLRYRGRRNLPSIDPELTHSANPFTLVIFTPPKLRNLEYFTIYPIYLQGAETENPSDDLYKKIDRYRRPSDVENVAYVSDEVVLERINTCLEARLGIQRVQTSYTSSQFFPFQRLFEILRIIQYPVSVFARFFIAQVLTVIVALISILNKDIRGNVPVKVSSLCRQLDIRLRQLSFLPIQFLCYYEGDVLSNQTRELLKLSFPNENHNIKNSYYINFYNTVWMTINDMILGRVFYSFWKEKYCHFLSLSNFFQSLAFTELNKIVSWVGIDHPAGFKLNNDLGQFMEAMIIWTSLMWLLITEAISDLFESVPILSWAASSSFNVICCCGLSFVLAYFVDYIKVASLHVSFFNIATSKIYYQQLQMLKSLMQLFRGKKYNVLRNRIDSIEEDDYRIDQLLLGTFCFMILIYLLPTTFAFYFLFFAMNLSLLTLVKLGEKVIVVLNFFPIFIVMLKLKNSRRLQGGIYFEALGSYDQTNWLFMRNKALTLDNILSPFGSVFHQQGRIPRLSLNFIEGRQLEVQNCAQMKLKYLMLPEDYSQLKQVWRNIQ